MRLLMFSILLVIFAGCNLDTAYNYNLDPEEKIEAEIRKEVFWQLKKEKDLYPRGFGGGMRGTDKVQFLYLAFSYHHQIDIKKARELLMTAGNAFLEAINKNKQIPPYLGVYPFPPKKIEICIFILNRDGTEFPPEELYAISMEEGILKYKVGMLDSRGYRMTIYEESYEEAMAKFSAVVSSSSDL